MKVKLLISFLLIFAFAAGVYAQQKTTVITIKTSAQCEMCKNRIEKALAFEKGVVSSELNLESKVLTVKYKEGKTTPDRIRKAVNAVGYDADNSPAVAKAYESLPPCCKKPGDPAQKPH